MRLEPGNGQDSQWHWDEECGRLLEQLRDHHQAGGPPIHIDILADDDEPGIFWPQIYIMSPVFREGCIVGWWCTGCGHEEACR